MFCNTLFADTISFQVPSYDFFILSELTMTIVDWKYAGGCRNMIITKIIYCIPQSWCIGQGKYTFINAFDLITTISDPIFNPGKILLQSDNIRVIKWVLPYSWALRSFEISKIYEDIDTLAIFPTYGFYD